jgi:DNA-binding transcriptional MerR regulator
MVGQRAPQSCGRKKMKGFYNKQEAARILGVSTRQINVYFTKGTLRRVYNGNRVWTPHEDVHALYNKASRTELLDPAEAARLVERVDTLEKQMITLRRGLGFGAKKDLRSETDLLLLRQEHLELLARPEWTTKDISNTSEVIMSLRPEELSTLVQSVGAKAWAPFCELGVRMLRYVERHPQYPDKGFDILHSRLEEAQNKFYGIIHASGVAPTGLPSREAATIYRAAMIQPTAVDKYVLRYLQASIK